MKKIADTRLRSFSVDDQSRALVTRVEEAKMSAFVLGTGDYEKRATSDAAQIPTVLIITRFTIGFKRKKEYNTNATLPLKIGEIQTV
ncbi:hypothetical protein POVWA2_006890 [Plasmodium ovale wallikeri]|uniref:Uncharacterized protein n=1 Tax=Plasmodium ovale wallikeri TaxID=864142 RepID=A0A1A8YKM5_PLAOA|nr:hypothetical protein POVWA2_006890 [Plasmodium ovale wallikeri]